MSEDAEELDTDGEEAPVSIPEMHTLFSDWLRPTELGIDRETLVLRWAGIAEMERDELSWEREKELIRTALECPIASDGPNHWLRAEFKGHDNQFPMQPGSNDREMACLAAAYLALCLDDASAGKRAGALATTILSSSFCNEREFAGAADLSAMAKQVAVERGLNRRKRISPQSPPLKYVIGDETETAITAVAANQPATLQAALRSVLGEMKLHFGAAGIHIKKYNDGVQEQSAIQDEELEILWWLFGGKSKLVDMNLSDTDELALPILIGSELAIRTTMDAELPSFLGLAKKAGIHLETKLVFSTMIDSCKPYEADILEKDIYCPIITPALYALHLAKENTNWKEPWELATGMSVEKEASQAEWALQFYRENLVVRQWG